MAGKIYLKQQNKCHLSEVTTGVITTLIWERCPGQLGAPFLMMCTKGL